MAAEQNRHAGLVHTDEDLSIRIALAARWWLAYGVPPEVFFTPLNEADRRDYELMLNAQKYRYTVAQMAWQGDDINYRGMPSRRFVWVSN